MSPLANRARATLAQPEPEDITDEELLAVLDNATAGFPPLHPEAEPLNAVEYALALELRKTRIAIAADRARKAPLNLVTWQAIKTAPRDGRFFIGANTNEAIVCNWPKQKNVDYAPGKWRKSQGEWNGSIICTNSPLTHWQALPTLPIALPTPEVTND